MQVYQLRCLIELFVFLLDGQKIAKRLSKQLSKEKKLMLSYFHKYNTVSSSSITLDEALDPVTISSKLESFGAFHIATGNKRDIIDAYLLFCRSKEELVMLEAECNNIVSFYEDQLIAIQKYIEVNDTNLGMTSLLHKLKEKISALLEQGHNVRRQMAEERISSVMESDDSDFDDESSDEELL